jgi:hypothetical protein
MTKPNLEGAPSNIKLGADTALNPDEVLEFVKNYVAPNSVNKTLNNKTKDFRDMIYLFNADPGMQNPEFEYVIGADVRVDKSEQSAEADNMSKMVPEFTSASRKLFNYDETEKRGGFMRVEQYDREFGTDRYKMTTNTLVDTRGTMSDLVWTDYGAHIIMYTRNISDFIFTNTADMIGANLETFMNATFTSYGNKTYFDAAVERVTRPTYSAYEQNLIADYRAVNKTKLWKDRYNDLTNAK